MHELDGGECLGAIPKHTHTHLEDLNTPIGKQETKRQKKISTAIYIYMQLMFKSITSRLSKELFYFSSACLFGF